MFDLAKSKDIVRMRILCFPDPTPSKGHLKFQKTQGLMVIKACWLICVYIQGLLIV